MKRSVDHTAYLEMADRQSVTVRCAHCGWTYAGTLADGRQAHAAHRLDKHDIRVVTRKRNGRSPWSSHQPLVDNIAAARAQGAARWYDGDAL